MTFSRVLRLLFVVYVPISLFAGYWDLSLSNAFLYDGQMSWIHFRRTMQVHFLLGTIGALVIAVLITRRKPSILRDQLVPNHIAFITAALLFLIVGIKIHLAWLDTRIWELEGLLWTLVLVAGCFTVYWIVRAVAGRIKNRPVAAIIFLILLSGSFLHWWLTQPRIHEPIRPSMPNVLLVVLDTLRWDHTSAYGHRRKTTPAIDRLASEGTLYETAISPSPWTTPSHASLFTGQYPSRCGVDGRNIVLDPASKTLAQTLRGAGYQTAGFTNNVYIRRQTGLARGFQQYEEFWGDNEGSSLLLLFELLKERSFPRQDTGARETVDATQHWLDLDWNGKNPFFLFVHFMEPHAPYGVPQKYLREFLPPGVSTESAQEVPQDPDLYISGKIPMTEKDFEILKGLYDNDIRYVDTQVESLLRNLRTRDLLDNTIVILTADHGEHFGEHRLMSHELSVYDVLLRVPLIVRYPQRFARGTRINDVVQTLDVFPTILELLGIPKSAELQGNSFMDRKNHPYVFAEYDNARAVDKMENRFKPDLPPNPVYQRKVLKVARNGEFKLIWGSDGTRELYSIHTDPYETQNLYSQQQLEAKKLEAALAKWLSSFKPSGFYKQEQISKDALEELRSLGYVN